MAMALAGCRFDVTPGSFDRSSDLGQAVTETLEIRNTGDEPLEFSLATDGASLTLSATSGVLQPAETIDVEISAECDDPGSVHTGNISDGSTAGRHADPYGESDARLGLPDA